MKVIHNNQEVLIDLSQELPTTTLEDLKYCKNNPQNIRVTLLNKDTKQKICEILLKDDSLKIING